MKHIAGLCTIGAVVWFVIGLTRTGPQQESAIICSNTILIIAGVALILDKLDRR